MAGSLSALLVFFRVLSYSLELLDMCKTVWVTFKNINVTAAPVEYSVLPVARETIGPVPQPFILLPYTPVTKVFYASSPEPVSWQVYATSLSDNALVGLEIESTWKPGTPVICE
jgi:hypothetical protein